MLLVQQMNLPANNPYVFFCLITDGSKAAVLQDEYKCMEKAIERHSTTQNERFKMTAEYSSKTLCLEHL